jgi:hypothetical protein
MYVEVDILVGSLEVKCYTMVSKYVEILNNATRRTFYLLKVLDFFNHI